MNDPASGGHAERSPDEVPARLESQTAAGRADAGMGLACDAVSFSYEEAKSPIAALDDVSFGVPGGGSLAVLGASGAGKSTLLQVIKGLDPPRSGVVRLDGLDPTAGGYDAARRQVGLVFQQPELQLFASSAAEDVAFGPRRLGWPETEVREAVAEALQVTGLPPAEFAQRHPYTLSGGEQRRLALAGVLAMRPRLLLLDEPFVSLDPLSRRELVAILERLKAGGVTLVLATHDVDLAWALCDELLVLRGGSVATSGRWQPGEESAELLAANRLEEPFLVQLWRRLGRDPAAAPRTVAAAAEALS